ncbi:hypothetical protein TSUD_92930 [Trifolium subterraneum]|uniref:Uncharacterized protein n=1 Tax=Trifolium subterraneum TaxID=3900 RepID=A0A2Z6N9W3_TRISU|nr:hypothetical protein TSUD_92930 [Trifolium subterraneum]
MNLGNDDLKIEILLRLPVKSLMRFKCVQRSWNKLIKSHYFVSRRSQLCIPQNHSLLITENSKLKLLLCERDNEKPILKESLFPNDIARIESYGSCNGVFCLKSSYSTNTSFSYDELIMWNPTTNEVHRIPCSPLNCRGFLYGFDVVKDNFKVVKLNVYNIDMMNMLCPSSEIYDLGTKSWTVIQNHLHNTIVTRQHPSRYNAVNDILCFNFHNNQFQQLKGPNIRHTSDSYCDNVINIKGSLGYVVNFHMVCLEIWVMDQNKWSKKYNINNPFTSMFGTCGPWNDGAEILGANVGELLASYDHHGNKLRKFQIEYGYFMIYEYVPSIALLS